MPTALEEMELNLANAGEVSLKSLDPKKTLLIAVDMINGFAKKGALSSPRIGALIPAVVSLARMCGAAGISKIAFADAHAPCSAEFGSYPPHCLKGTEESELVDELKNAGEFLRIDKNSTNGFLEEDFLRCLGQNSDWDTFVIAGDCTDLCILQLALSLRAHFNRLNLPSRIIVPKNAVDTYDAPGHSAELMQLFALTNLKLNGVEIVERITA